MEFINNHEELYHKKYEFFKMTVRKRDCSSNMKIVGTSMGLISVHCKLGSLHISVIY